METVTTERVSPPAPNPAAERENAELLDALHRTETEAPNLERVLHFMPYFELPRHTQCVLAHIYASQYGARGSQVYTSARIEYDPFYKA